MSFGDQRGTRSCVCARVHACVQERALRGAGCGAVRHGMVEPRVSPAGHGRTPCCSVLAAVCDVWMPRGGGPVQARAGAHHPHLALGSGPSGRMSCLGLGPQPGPPSSSPGVWSRLHVGPRWAWQEPSAQACHGRAGCEDGRRLPVIIPTVLLPAEAEGSQMAWRVCLGGSKPLSVRLLGY